MKSKSLKLHLACGPNIIDGWDNLDILKTNGIINHDLRKALPYKDNSVDAIFHEHFIEHLTKLEAEFFLSECLRVIRPGGAMRIGWPDMKKLLNAYFFKRSKYMAYVGPHQEDKTFDKDWDEMISDCLFGWEHRYAYTSNHLKKVLLRTGFENVRTMKPGVSNYDIALDFRRDPATTYLEVVKSDA